MKPSWFELRKVTVWSKQGKKKALSYNHYEEGWTSNSTPSKQCLSSSWAQEKGILLSFLRSIPKVITLKDVKNLTFWRLRWRV